MLTSGSTCFSNKKNEKIYFKNILTKHIFAPPIQTVYPIQLHNRKHSQSSVLALHYRSRVLKTVCVCKIVYRTAFDEHHASNVVYQLSIKYFCSVFNDWILQCRLVCVQNGLVRARANSPNDPPEKSSLFFL